MEGTSTNIEHQNIEFLTFGIHFIYLVCLLTFGLGRLN